MKKMKVIVSVMNLNHVNISMLRVLVSLAETRSFTKTGARVGLSQSAVSHSLRALEAAVSAPLFLRDRKTMRLTNAGQRAVEAAQAALASIERLMRVGDAVIQGEVTLALVPSASTRVLPTTLDLLRQRHPSLEVSVLLGTDQEVASWVENGIADAGIGYDAGDCRSDVLLRDQLYLVSSRRMPAFQEETVRITDLENCPFIMSAAGCGPMVTALLEQAGVSPQVVLTAHDTGALFALVGSGLGVSIVPSLSFAPNWEKTVLRHRLRPRVMRPLYFLRGSGPTSQALEAVTAAACESLAEVSPAA